MQKAFWYLAALAVLTAACKSEAGEQLDEYDRVVVEGLSKAADSVMKNPKPVFVERSVSPSEEATPVVLNDLPAEQTALTELGDQPGLGSSKFVMSDQTFSFSPKLHVEYRRSRATMLSGNKYGKTTPWRAVRNPVRYAYDHEMMEEGMAITAVQVNGEWFMPFGGGVFVYKSAGQYDVWSVCMDEQACADFRTHKKKGSKARLEASVREVIATTGKINSFEYCKRHKCKEE